MFPTPVTLDFALYLDYIRQDEQNKFPCSSININTSVYVGLSSPGGGGGGGGGPEQRISLQCSIGNALVYIGLNSDGILTWSRVPRGEYLYQSMVCLLAVR